MVSIKKCINFVVLIKKLKEMGNITITNDGQYAIINGILCKAKPFTDGSGCSHCALYKQCDDAVRGERQCEIGFTKTGIDIIWSPVKYNKI